MMLTRALAGLFVGYLLSLILLSIFNTLQNAEWLTFSLYLVGIALGVVWSFKAFKHLPFIQQRKTKLLLVDAPTLIDPRLIDLAASGLLDHRLLIPRFLLQSYEQEEEKLALENLRKLEAMPDLHLRYSDTDFPEVKEPFQKLVKLGALHHCDLLTAHPSPPPVHIRLINLHALSNALKPFMQRGEYLSIKIQRLGKEENQGVGYLEDGTMIVVNGGGDFMGKTIKAAVLSVKQSTTGRMVFCNVAEN